MKFKAIILLLILAVVTIPAVGYPTPSKASKPGIWTLNTGVLQPQQLTVNMPGKGPQRFWYTILTVTNKGFEDVRFFPNCELVTDTFKVTLAGTECSGLVYSQLQKRYQGQYPFLESLENFNRRVLVGSDNTRDIAIIWPDFDANAKKVALYIAGLSNEIAKVDHPAKTDESGNPQQVLLRKTLELNYSISGDPARRSEASLKYLSKSWVMR